MTPEAFFGIILPVGVVTGALIFGFKVGWPQRALGARWRRPSMADRLRADVAAIARRSLAERVYNTAPHVETHTQEVRVR